MNHLAFHVPAERFDEYRERLTDKVVAVGPMLNQDREFACWTQEFGDQPAVPRRTAAQRLPRPHPPVTP